MRVVMRFGLPSYTQESIESRGYKSTNSVCWNVYVCVQYVCKVGYQQQLQQQNKNSILRLRRGLSLFCSLVVYRPVVPLIRLLR